MSGSQPRPAAAGLLAARLGAESRVLVLGAGGWFGSTALGLVAAAGGQASMLALTGRPRELALGGRSFVLGGWDWERVEAFAPSLVVNCAFLTRERVEQVGFAHYVAENVTLSARFLRTLALGSVQAAVTVSSGAAVAPEPGVPDLEASPYAQLKWSEEILSRAVASSHGVALVVCRAWSVSGPRVTRPLDYAFSDLILQAAGGEIRIRAPHEVWRRYTAVEDLLAVCIALASDGASETVESGGELVELGELARRVVAELAPGISVGRATPDGSPADRYHSDGRSWEQACRRLRYEPASLEHQIGATAAALIAR